MGKNILKATRLHIMVRYLGIIVFGFSLFAGVAAPKKPNILFISVDDLRDWVGFMGGYKGKVHTPHMDELASRGTAFLNAHTAAPVCCPSRAAVMSGLLPSTSGIYNNGHWWKPNLPELVTLPEHFRNNGYLAVGAGKIFHHTAGNNPPAVWDEYHRLVFNDDAFSRSSGRYLTLYPYTKPQPVPKEFPYSGIKLYSPEVDWGALPKQEKLMDDYQTVKYCTDFLARKHTKPFFLACGIFHPHLPWYVPKKYLDLYPVDQVQLPEVLSGDLNDIPETGQKLALRKNPDLKRIMAAKKWKSAVAHYLASVTYADARVGQLLKGLDQSDYAENTIIVLWSDHGWHFGEKEHWHKRTLWHVCTRVPFIVVAPGVGKSQQRSNRPVSLLDIYPTLIELCDLSKQPGLDGVSLVPLLKNPQALRQEPVVTVSEDQHVSLVDGRYRLIRYRDGSEELYDRRLDPHEWNNRAADPKLKEAKQRLSMFVPRKWAKPALNKKAFQFNPHTYTWKHKKTGQIIEGKNNP